MKTLWHDVRKFHISLQLEEEENAREMIAAVEAVEDNKYGMYMLDKELSARTYTIPSPLATSAG